MNTKNKLSISMIKGEVWAGILYLPVYFGLLTMGLTLLFDTLGWEHTTAKGVAQLNFCYFALNALFMLLLFHRFLWSNFKAIKKRFWGFVQAVILGGVMYYAGTYLVGLLIALLSPDMVNHNDQGILTMMEELPWAIPLGAIVLAPLAEECLMRGLIFGGIHKKSRIGAYVVSTLVFAFIHVGGYIGQDTWTNLALAFLQYVPAGIALGWAYEKADSVFAPMVIHMLVNALAIRGLA